MGKYSWMVFVPFANIFSEGVTTLVSKFPTILEHCLANTWVFKRITIEICDSVIVCFVDFVVFSVQIIPIKFSGKIHGLIPKTLAHSCVGYIVIKRNSSIEEDGATGFCPGLVE